ncbi:MAG: FAD-dependent oxidoreductase, partial [Actinobacteria bacterium]|nr:FAD-dependent oxidoreductase [Actinomycetota bacterium]
MILVVGAGLAGLSCAFELVSRGRDVLVVEARDVVGGRTSSWIDDGMPVESGLHRFLGFYTHLPGLLERAGIGLDEMLVWEDEVEVRVADGPSAVIG